MLHVPMRSRMSYSLEAYDQGFGRISFKKIKRKVGAFVAGTMTAGLIPPKALGIKSKAGRRMFRVGRAVGIATVVVAAAIATGPAVLAKLGTYTAKFSGVLKSFAPKALAKLGPQVATQAMKTLTEKGIPPEQAARMLEEEASHIVEADTPQQAMAVGQVTGVPQTAQAGIVGGVLPIVLVGGVVAAIAFGRRR